MFNYFCLNPISQYGLEKFGDNFQKVDTIDEAQGVLVRSASMHELDVPDSLLAVARAGAGVNNIPLKEYAKRGIIVFNTPGANANGVKELLLAGLLMSARDITGGIEWVKENKDDPDIAKTAEKAKKAFAGKEIAGKTLGVIGLGAIGGIVANAAHELGMEVYGYDPYISVEGAWRLKREIHYAASLDEIYANADYITVHVGLNDKTKHTVNEDAIAKMKDGVVILNLARDLLCDEEAVIRGLASKKIARYVTDFPNPTIAGVPGAIVIPHLGASTDEAEDNCARMACKELMRYLQNGNILNGVNFPTVDLGVPTATDRVTIIHKNIANMLTQFTKIIGEHNINIENMINKAKDEYAYTIIDTGDIISDEVFKTLERIDGVIRVRLIREQNEAANF